MCTARVMRDVTKLTSSTHLPAVKEVDTFIGLPCWLGHAGALKGAVLWDTYGSGLSIIALKEADSGLMQWALYHYIASLGDGTADTDGWLTMTVHDGGFKHTAQKAEHISKGQSLPLLWWLVASALVPCLLDFLPMLVQSPTSPGEKREAL